MDKGVIRYINAIADECIYDYGLSVKSVKDRQAVLRHTYKTILGCLPFENRTLRKELKSEVGNLFGFKDRWSEYIMTGVGAKAKEIEQRVKYWECGVFGVGTSHTLRPASWYEDKGWLLKDLGLIDDNGNWQRERYKIRMQYAGKKATIISRNGSRVRIAQDCGIHEWELLELMEGEDEGLGTQTAS